MIGFANLVEHGTPLIRFAQWHLEADDAPVPKIALTAIATAVWTPAR
ncbi:hypothetical protein [Sphingomonas morindae]|uniref:Uncharacterized protein n=1 Tax=Sphingomonas morindae TaxID=1541170 RepID=A0ABY4X9E3_9SPHN|nr:hypothetical protein [Sphingomonas morindae]USI73547.1 hypothetical protein LHA26_03435 [Sphingomonas morindae]